MKSIYMSQRRRRETELTSEWNEKGERRRMQTKINASVVGSHTERQALTATGKEKESSSVWEKNCSRDQILYQKIMHYILTILTAVISVYQSRCRRNYKKD